MFQDCSQIVSEYVKMTVGIKFAHLFFDEHFCNSAPRGFLSTAVDFEVSQLSARFSISRLG